MAPPSKIMPGNGRSVLIHVFDEYRKTAKDFVCQRDLLLAKMEYFRTYLNQSNEHDEIDISVHCDVEIFEWLVEYMQQSEHEWKPRITLENIASILVSSEFLQMQALVDECIRFITARMQEFLQLRVDFGCLSDATLSKIAQRCSAEELQQLQDPKGKMLVKLQRKKLDALLKQLQDRGRVLSRCVNCEHLFLQEHQLKLGCRNGKRQIAKHGELISYHEPKVGWRVDEFLRELTVEKSVTWDAAYWYVWASTHCFACGLCKKKYTLLELQQCQFHPGQVVGSGMDAGFSCCGAHIFDGDERAIIGCTARDHIPAIEDTQTYAHVFETIKRVPLVWDILRRCDQAARLSALTTPDQQQQVEIGIDLESLFGSQLALNTNEQVESNATKLKTAAPSSSAAAPGVAVDASASSQRKKQWRALQLQEKDRMRQQLLARRLLQMRKNLTS